MKNLTPLLSLFIICVPGNSTDTKSANIAEPVSTVISTSFKKVCHLKDFYGEVGAYQNYAVKVASKINTKLADHKSKLSEILPLMCQEDRQLRSSAENVIKKACDSTAPQSDIVQKIIDRTCNNLVPSVLKSWWKGMDVDVVGQ